MSVYGPKQTWPNALQMSAFGGKADMTIAMRNVAAIWGMALVNVKMLGSITAARAPHRCKLIREWPEE